MKQIYYIFFIGLLLLKTSGTYAQDLSGITIYVNPGHGGFDSDDRNIPVITIKSTMPRIYINCNS